MSELNCLQCRHCALLPQTNFKHKAPSIRCGVIQEPRVINFEGCVNAEPTRLYRSGRKWSEVANAFLKAHYERAEMADLEKRLGRDNRAIYQQARRLGFKGERKAIVMRGRALVMLGTRRTWTPEQDNYLRRIYGTEKWPIGGAGQDERRKAVAIKRRVNRLGPRHTWRAIKERAGATTPAGRKRADLKREKHTIYQREHPKGKQHGRK